METFLVGGAVRDQLLDYPYHEKDWVVVGATPKEMTKKGFRPVGKDFPVFIHPETGEEYALARTERKTAPGYKGFTFHTAPEVSIEEDLLRRDLTINSIAKAENSKIIDPYGGILDIQARWLRHTSIAFAEDPVRILRVARFLARYQHLGFKIHPETLSLMRTMVEAGETKHLVPERVWQETVKALGEKKPSAFFETLKTCGALKDIFPEFEGELFYSAQSHLLTVAEVNTSQQGRFTSLCLALNSKQIKSLCKRLGCPNAFSELAFLAAEVQSQILEITTLSAKNITQVLKKSDCLRKPERFSECVEVVSQTHATDNSEKIKTFWGALCEAYRGVDTQALLAKGLQGPEIGIALEKERLASVQQILERL